MYLVLVQTSVSGFDVTSVAVKRPEYHKHHSTTGVTQVQGVNDIHAQLQLCCYVKSRNRCFYYSYVRCLLSLIHSWYYVYIHPSLTS